MIEFLKSTTVTEWLIFVLALIPPICVCSIAARQAWPWQKSRNPFVK